MPAFVRDHTLPNGESVTLYPISYLAVRLGRDTQTIRKWEVGGVLPESMFRDKNKNRLYSEEQIDAITKIAEKCKISQGRRLANTNFSRYCHEELNAIKERYLKKKEKHYEAEAKAES